MLEQSWHDMAKRLHRQPWEQHLSLETADLPRITTSKIGCEWDHYQLLSRKTLGINTGSYKDLQRSGTETQNIHHRPEHNMFCCCFPRVKRDRAHLIADDVYCVALSPGWSLHWWCKQLHTFWAVVFVTLDLIILSILKSLRVSGYFTMINHRYLFSWLIPKQMVNLRMVNPIYQHQSWFFSKAFQFQRFLAANPQLHRPSRLPGRRPVSFLQVGSKKAGFKCHSWLVVDLPLWKIWKSNGIIVPNIWKIIHMFQSTNQHRYGKLW